MVIYFCLSSWGILDNGVNWSICLYMSYRVTLVGTYRHFYKLATSVCRNVDWVITNICLSVCLSWTYWSVCKSVCPVQQYIIFANFDKLATVSSLWCFHWAKLFSEVTIVNSLQYLVVLIISFRKNLKLLSSFFDIWDFLYIVLGWIYFFDRQLLNGTAVVLYVC